MNYQALYEASATQLDRLRAEVEDLLQKNGTLNARLAMAEIERDSLRTRTASFDGQLESLKRDRDVARESAEKRREMLRRYRVALTRLAEGDVPGEGDFAECMQAFARETLQPDD